MAKVEWGSRKKPKKGPKIVFLILFLVIVMISGFFGYNYYTLRNSYENSLNYLTYTISFEDDIYFIRVVNNNRRVYIVKADNNSIFPDTRKLLDSNNLILTTQNFNSQFKLNSQNSTFIRLNDQLKNILIDEFGGQKYDVEGFFDSLKFRNTSLLDYIKMNSLVNQIKKFDRESNITQGALYVLLNSFSNYSINRYDSLYLETYFDEPIIITVQDEQYKRNYINQSSIDRIGTILE